MPGEAKQVVIKGAMMGAKLRENLSGVENE